MVLPGVVGNSSYTLQHALTLLPYKLLYASQLAEHGLISEATQYCGVIQQAIGAVPKLPPGLSVCNTFTKDLLDRLQSYAAVSVLLMQIWLDSCMYFGCPSVMAHCLQHYHVKLPNTLHCVMHIPEDQSCAHLLDRPAHCMTAA